MDTKTYYVYIEANNRNRVFYVGITNNLVRRDKEHENTDQVEQNELGNVRTALCVGSLFAHKWTSLKIFLLGRF